MCLFVSVNNNIDYSFTFFRATFNSHSVVNASSSAKMIVYKVDIWVIMICTISIYHLFTLISRGYQQFDKFFISHTL